MVMPDAEVLAVQWAKANSALNTILSGRVATRLPKEPVFPFLTVFRVTGGPDTSEATIDIPILQWDAYGAARGDAAPDYDNASLVARTLVTEIDGFRGDFAGVGTILTCQVVSGPRRRDEPETGWARYIVETTMATRELL